MDNPIENPVNQPVQPLEMPSNLTPPEPMGGSGSPTNLPAVGSNRQPSSSSMPPKEQKGGRGSYILMIIIGIILIIGVLVFLSWKDWISLGGLEKLWGGGKVTPIPMPKITSEISPSPIPSSATTSPQVTTNINDQTRKNDLATIKNALKKYYETNSVYPVSQTVTKTSDTESTLTKALTPTFLEKLPNDPLAPTYYYGYKSDGTTFEITTVLEDKTDPAGTTAGTYFIYKVTDISKE